MTGKIGAVIRAFFVHGVSAFVKRRAQGRHFWKTIGVAALNYRPGETSIDASLPTVTLESIFPGATSCPITLLGYEERTGQPEIQELVSICHIVRFLKPGTVFEFGTFEGGTTLQIAANSEARIWTLDLGPDEDRPLIDPEIDVYPDLPGWRIMESELASRYVQLLGNSRTFDFSDWQGSIDLVFVDGSHHFEDVRSDSENAMRMRSPEGIIIWHDYAPYAPGVKSVLEELARERRIMRIEGTSLAVYAPAHGGSED